jgi:hypothetical protein
MKSTSVGLIAPLRMERLFQVTYWTISIYQEPLALFVANCLSLNNRATQEKKAMNEDELMQEMEDLLNTTELKMLAVQAGYDLMEFQTKYYGKLPPQIFSRLVLHLAIPPIMLTAPSQGEAFAWLNDHIKAIVNNTKYLEQQIIPDEKTE